MAIDIEQRRREIRATGHVALAEAVEAGEQVWDTAQLTTDFEVMAFADPYVVVRRIKTQEVGTLQFTHAPRYYFGWVADRG